MHDPQPATDRQVREVPIEGVTRMLRLSGAFVLIAAASTFLFQHWQQGQDVQRYLGLLALTAALPAAGFFCGLRIGETKGARTLLAVAASLLPAHFCLLGAFLYSRFAWGSGLVPMPTYALWTAPSDAAALAVTAGALVVLAPIAWVAFLALARPHAVRLTAAYLGVNALLLVPSRDPQLMALLLAASVLGLAAIEAKIGGDRALRTLEGVMVRCLMVAAPVLLAARSWLHYDVSALWLAVVCAALAAVGLGLARQGRLRPTWRVPLETSSLVPAAGAALALATAGVQAGMPEPLALPAASLPFAALLALLSLGAGPRGATLRGAAAAVALGAAALNVTFGGVFASLWCLAIAIPCAGYGLASERRWLLLSAGIVSLATLAHHVQEAVQLYAASAWAGLALLGIAVILAASVLERQWPRLAGRWAEAGRGRAEPVRGPRA